MRSATERRLGTNRPTLSRSAGEPDGGAHASAAGRNSSLRAKRFALTFPRCEVLPELARRRLRKVHGYVSCVVVREPHLDGSPHLHVLLELSETLVIRHSVFDRIARKHGNYQAERSPARWLRYLLKSDPSGDNLSFDGEEPHERLERIRAKRGVKVSDAVAKLIMEGTSLKEIAVVEPGFTLMHSRAMREFEDLTREDAADVPFKLSVVCGPEYREESGVLVEWLTDNIGNRSRPIKTPQLWICSPPNVGKSSLIARLDEAIKVYTVLYKGNWFGGYSENIDLINMDDYHAEKTMAELNRLVDGSITKLDRKGLEAHEKRHNVPTIVMSNTSIRGTYCNIVDESRIVAVESRFLELVLTEFDHIWDIYFSKWY